MQKLYKFSIFISVAATLLVVSQHKFFNTFFTNPQQRYLSYVQELDNEESKAWQLLNKLGVKQSDFEAKKAAFLETQAKKKGQHKLSKELNTLLTNTVSDWDIDPNTLSFTAFNERTEAATDLDTIFVNPDFIQKLPKDAAHFVIGHEAQHLLRHEAADQQILEELLKNADQKLANEAINNLIRLQEKRADVQTALKSEDYAKSYISYAQFILNEYGESTNKEHPKMSTRLKLAQEIYNNIYANNELA